MVMEDHDRVTGMVSSVAAQKNKDKEHDAKLNKHDNGFVSISKDIGELTGAVKANTKALREVSGKLDKVTIRRRYQR
jgi:hypothetical protein